MPTLKTLFKRYRRPGDMFWAMIILAFASFLLVTLPSQTSWQSGGTLAAQPRFWPVIAIGGMMIFGLLHLGGSLLSERIEGRWREVRIWLSSFEYAAWFIAYAMMTPWMGYLPTTLLFMLALTFRAGYRSRRTFVAVAGVAIITVILFRAFLQVKLPAGEIYEALPDGLRQFFLTYL